MFGMAKRHPGKPSVFSRKQNQALRNLLLELRGTYSSQKALGEALGIAQQNAARLLSDRRAGFAYATASAVVRLAGFAGVDAFFADRGLLDVVEPVHVREAS